MAERNPKDNNRGSNDDNSSSVGTRVEIFVTAPSSPSSSGSGDGFVSVVGSDGDDMTRAVLSSSSSSSSCHPSSSSTSSSSSLASITTTADIVIHSDAPNTVSPHTSSDQAGEDESDHNSPVYNPTTEPTTSASNPPPSSSSSPPARCCFRLCRSIKKRLRAKRKAKKEGEGEGDIGDGGGRVAFNRSQWFLLLVLCLATLTSSFAVCLFPPFFPKIAQAKGCSSTIFGLIIGTNCLTSFIVTPFIGKKLRTIGVKFAFTAGVFCSGGCCILSGFLEWFPGGLVFVLMAILIRLTHAVANAGVSTATFAYIAVQFPDSVAQVFAWTRTTMNLAQMFGPVVGGALLELGGFKLPFLVMGTVQMSMTLLSLGLPRDSTYIEDDVKNYQEVKIWKIFTVRGIWVSFLTFIFSTMSNGFLSITLEPQVIRTFGYSSLYVGLLFGLKDGANSLASPIWGYVCDRNRKVKVFILWASCFAFTSFFLLGPFPGVPINRTIGVVIASLVLNGVGIGGQQVAGVVDAMREAVSAGFPESADTHGCVAGLWASLSGIGRFTSRTGSGFLVDVLGFRKASVFVVSLHGFVVVMTATYLAVWGDLPYTRRRRNDGDDSSNEDDDRRSWDVKAGMSRILTTTPTDPLTTKTVNINIPTYGEDFEDSLFCGSAPMSYKTKYERSGASGSPQSQEVV